MVAINGNVGSPLWVGRPTYSTLQAGPERSNRELSPSAGYNLGDPIDPDGNILLSTEGETRTSTSLC